MTRESLDKADDIFGLQDEVPQVRERFAAKLHQGLSRRIPLKCLPLDFMGYYALAGAEKELRLKKLVQEYMSSDIQRRRDYIKAVTMSGCEYPR